MKAYLQTVISFFIINLIIINAVAQQLNNAAILPVKDVLFSEPENIHQYFSAPSIMRIDSIGRTNDEASPFCNIYSTIMSKIGEQIMQYDPGGRNFVKQFEVTFADYFLTAWDDHKKGILADSSEWKYFFTHGSAESWQNILMGVNAHVNCNIWESLVDNFSFTEIKKYRNDILGVQRSIARIYSPLFDSWKLQSKRLRIYNSITLGLLKISGERLVYKWRRRNVKLAILYYKNPTRFIKKHSSVYKKKDRIDNRIMKRKF